MNAQQRIDLLRALREAVGPTQVLTEGDLSAWEQDWRKRWHGRSLAVVRPGSVAEVAAVVRACASHGARLSRALACAAAVGKT